MRADAVAPAGPAVSRRRPVRPLVLPAGAGAVFFAVRFLTQGPVENDHFAIVARSRQVLFGDWPVFDFIDPGMPLTYLVSAAAAWLAGPTLLTEVALTLALIALAAAITVASVRRDTGSVALALLMVPLMLVLPTRLYSATKVLALVTAACLGCRYADRPSIGRLATLAGWTGIACLVRFDYAVYIGAAALLLVTLRHAADPRTVVRRLLLYAVCALLVVAPWLLYVDQALGLGEYIASAARFADAERSRTVTGLPRFVLPMLAPVNTSAFLFYGCLAIPAAALAVAARTGDAAARARLVFVAVLAALCDVAFLRDAIADRLGDVVALSGIAGALAVGRVVHPKRIAAPSAAGIAVLTFIAGTAFLRESGARSFADAASQWTKVSDALWRSTPDVAPGADPLGTAAFIRNCTRPDDRVIVSGFAPEIPVLANRPFAGGLPSWLLGYYVLEPDVRIVERHLAGERVGAVVLLEGTDVFVRSWPSIAERLRASGLREYPLPGGRADARIWVRPSDRLASVGDAVLPCASASASGR